MELNPLSAKYCLQINESGANLSTNLAFDPIRVKSIPTANPIVSLHIMVHPKPMVAKVSSMILRKRRKIRGLLKEGENGKLKGGTCLIIGGEEENREGKGGRCLV